MKHLRGFELALAVGLAACGIAIPSAGAETVNRIAAVVNEDVITEADVSSRVAALLDDEGTARTNARPEEIHQAVLQRLIEQRLLLQEAKKANVTVGPEEVDARLEELRERAGTDVQFRRALDEAELTEEQLKEKLREQLMIQKLIDEKVRTTIVVSPQEITKAISEHPELVRGGDRVRVSHLLIRVGEQRTEAQARALIEDLRQVLSQGAEFATIAARYSEDDQAKSGGDLGWVASGDLLPELDAAVFNLRTGDVSSPIQSRLGFHLVRVEGRQPAAEVPTTEANRTITQHLYQQKFQEALGRWLEELKRHAYIDLVSSS